jgi:galactitol-specific phosphotransferase system IIB component
MNTQLQMASDDFNEGKYTESAWALIATITKAADFYNTNTVDAVLLLDVMMNPTKYNAGESAESANRVMGQILSKAGVEVKQLRQELEMYMAKQPKISGNMEAQKNMGRSLMKVLERAKDSKSMLGVR